MSDLTVERLILHHMGEVARLTEEGIAIQLVKNEEAFTHKRTVKRLVAKMFKVPERDLELGHWGCDKSPTGRCFYNSREDGALDHCLICGDPDERK